MKEPRTHTHTHYTIHTHTDTDRAGSQTVLPTHTYLRTWESKPTSFYNNYNNNVVSKTYSYSFAIRQESKRDRAREESKRATKLELRQGQGQPFDNASARTHLHSQYTRIPTQRSQRTHTTTNAHRRSHAEREKLRESNITYTNTHERRRRRRCSGCPTTVKTNSDAQRIWKSRQVACLAAAAEQSSAQS